MVKSGIVWLNMKNNYGLNTKELELLRKQYNNCVYCKKVMVPAGSDLPRKDWATIEHLNYLPPWNNIKTVVFCCWSCNSSRGNKRISKWFNSSFCTDKKISYKTVHVDVRKYIDKFEK